ncbi:cellulose biosynthesis protein BcsS [Ancylobacter sp. TS-1]|uniref:cellulose biosynthesis protein BcsS n=1 Tax=Ancylobacter sp. TS-1 TaxID=1850374 RepID=UPI001FF053A6|nr:cellulose biosynthesis protein BcsS [Ancylobacter sp. TS-1]
MLLSPVRIDARPLARPLAAALFAALCPEAAGGELMPASLKDRLYFFSGVDIARDTAYGWAGMAWAPFDRMDREGVRLRGQAGGGHYDYRTQAVPGGWNTGEKQEGEVLAGWQFLRGAHALALYGGVNVVDNRLQYPDPGNPDQGTQFGAKFVVEWFYRIDERRTLSAALAGSTADGTMNARASAGWRAFDWLDLGVEAGATTDWLDESARVGGFLLVPLARQELRVAGGWRWSSDSDDGAYGALSVFMPF